MLQNTPRALAPTLTVATTQVITIMDMTTIFTLEATTIVVGNIQAGPKKRRKQLESYARHRTRQ